ncbi:MAG TPA: PucR family transcriptional regulator ligand-binding domain-containing protein [Solirubrobacterales bacterium]|nr:PucR family transcriptional regulator ligand-binding domain-containing protein [Solirubrobacterales bacterium]
MPLTVAELTEIPFLKTRIHAGSSGAGKVIAWAHSIELPTPWEWLEPNDLLMTVGLGIPAAPEEQVAYVRKLAAAGVSAVAIGEEMQAPPLSAEMLAAADEESLPLLITAYEVPFVQVARAVAEANQAGGSDRAVRAARVYDRVRQVVERGSEDELLVALEQEVGCRLWVCANPTGAVLLGGATALDERISAELARALGERPPQAPGLMRLEIDEGACLVVSVPSRHPASLVVVPTTSPAPSYALLQHVATVAALELERQWSRREELSRTGAELFAQIQEGRAVRSDAAEQLRRRGLLPGPLVVLSAEAETEPDGRWDQLHHLLADRVIPNLLWRRGRNIDLLLGADEGTVGQVAEFLGPDVVAGVSDGFGDVESIADALREARWARERARTEGRPFLRYGEGAPTFGPRSVAEAEAVVERVLGPLLSYDAEHQSELTESLHAFLRANRSWKRGAAELFVHKQTLVYRMRRVEELTDRDLSETADVAELWLALEALERLRK